MHKLVHFHRNDMAVGGGKGGIITALFRKEASTGQEKKAKGSLQTPQKEDDNQIQSLRRLALCLEK